MSLNIQIECLPEPNLLFGDNETGVEPRRVMAKPGLRTSLRRKNFALALSGQSREFRLPAHGCPGSTTCAIAREKSARRYPNWPGAQKALGVTFVIEDRFVRPLDEERLDLALHRSSPSEKFDELLDIIRRENSRVLRRCPPGLHHRLSVRTKLLTCASAIPSSPLREREALERLQREEEQEQMSLFQPTPEELKAAEELRTQAEDLLFRTFYRALKARIMTHQNPVPVQVMRRDTFLRPEDEGQSYATRAWNLATSLFYKSGHEPWRPADLPGNTCFIGISFHHLKRREGRRGLCQRRAGILERNRTLRAQRARLCTA